MGNDSQVRRIRLGVKRRRAWQEEDIWANISKVSATRAIVPTHPRGIGNGPYIYFVLTVSIGRLRYDRLKNGY